MFVGSSNSARASISPSTTTPFEIVNPSLVTLTTLVYSITPSTSNGTSRVSTAEKLFNS